MSRRSKSYFFCLLLCFLALSLSATLLKAFLIPIHSNVTNEALDRFPGIEKWERKQMAKGCAAVDMLEGGIPFFGGPYEKRFHFDNDFSFRQVAANFVDVSHLIDLNLAKSEKDPWEFGKAMHAVEDLYSHSNYVVLYREFSFANSNQLMGSIPTFEEVLLQPDVHKDFLAILQERLHTGRYPTPAWHVIPQDTDHGPLIGPGGMHKDNPFRTLYDDARQTAVRSASWYVKLYLKDPATLSQWRRLESIQFGAAPK